MGLAEIEGKLRRERRERERERGEKIAKITETQTEIKNNGIDGTHYKCYLDRN